METMAPEQQRTPVRTSVDFSELLTAEDAFGEDTSEMAVRRAYAEAAHPRSWRDRLANGLERLGGRIIRWIFAVADVVRGVPY